MSRNRRDVVERVDGIAVIRCEEELCGRAPRSAKWVKLRASLVLPVLKLEHELLFPTATGQQARQLEAALTLWEAGEREALVDALLRLVLLLTAREVSR
jgi:hypothetical protein